MVNLNRFVISIATVLFFVNQSYAQNIEKYKYIEKYKCISPTFEKYLLSEYRKYNAEMCYIDFVEKNNKGTVIILDFYDKKSCIGRVWGKLDVRNYNIFLYGKYNCALFKKKNKLAKVNVEEYNDDLDENGYSYEIDDGIMISVLYNDEGVFKIDWINHSLHKIGN